MSISLDVSLVIQIINFIFLIWALNVVAYRPIRNALLKRKEKIDGLEEGIQNALSGATEKEDAFTSGIKAARAEGLKEKTALLELAAAEEKRIVGEITDRAQADLAAVREKIAKDTEGVKVALQAELDSFAEAISQKILGRAV